MTRLIIMTILLGVGLATAACGDGSTPEGPRLHVHILALDGVDLDIVRGLVAAKQMPNFERAIAAGAIGGLRSKSPRQRDIVWTTVATGRPSSEHGILEFVVLHRESERLRPLASFMRRTETLWEIASTNDLRVGVVGWPGTWPPDPVNGILVPDRFGTAAPAGEQAVFPPETSADLVSLRRRPKDISAASVNRLIIPRGGGERERILLEALATDETRRAATSRIAGDVDLLVTWSGFAGTVSHLFMSAASPKLKRVSEEDFEHYGQAVVGAYRHADTLLGEALARMDENTVVLVVSPYGFRHGIQRLRKDPATGAGNAKNQHRPRGFLLAVGAGVREGGAFEGARAVDIAPTVTALLGLPVAEDLGGRYLAEGFTIDAPEKVVPTWERDRHRLQIARLLGEGESAPEDLARFPSLAYIGSATHLSDPVSQVLIALSLRRTTDTLSIVEPALMKQPDSAILHGLLADLYRNRRKVERAEKEYRDAIRLAPDEVSYRVSLARLLARTERLPEAMEILDATLAEEPADAALHMVRGSLLVDAGRHREGLASLARAVELEPDSTAARMQLAAALLERGRVKAAERQLRAARDLDPRSRTVWNNLSVALIRNVEGAGAGTQDRNAALAAARDTLDEAVRRFPEYAKVWHNRALYHRMAGRREAARADVGRALALDPDYEAARELEVELR